MEKFFNKTIKVALITFMLFIIATFADKVSAYYTDSIKVNDKLKFGTGSYTEWNVYTSKVAAQNLNKSKGNVTTPLKKGTIITVYEKSGNVLKIGTNKYIYYGSYASSNFKKISAQGASGGTSVNTRSKTKTYTIVYNANRGTGAPGIKTYKSTDRQVIISSKKPTRNGYTFLGWSKSSNAGTVAYNAGDRIDNPNKNLVLYAVWQPVANKIKFGKSEYSIEVGKSSTIKATTEPSNAKISYKSDNTSIAKVDQNGKVTGVKAGTTKITAYGNGKSAVYKITVKNKTTNSQVTVPTTAKSGKTQTVTLTAFTPSENGGQNYALSALPNFKGNTEFVYVYGQRAPSIGHRDKNGKFIPNTAEHISVGSDGAIKYFGYNILGTNNTSKYPQGSVIEYTTGGKTVVGVVMDNNGNQGGFEHTAIDNLVLEEYYKNFEKGKTILKGERHASGEARIVGTMNFKTGKVTWK